jgi:predicted ATPase with chaperone activity
MSSKYQNRISGPILDHIDIHLEVRRVPIAKATSLPAVDRGQ